MLVPVKWLKSHKGGVGAIPTYMECNFLKMYMLISIRLDQYFILFCIPYVEDYDHVRIFFLLYASVQSTYLSHYYKRDSCICTVIYESTFDSIYRHLGYGLTTCERK